ncbi:hypothetical protein PGTUg99_010825 [Puccinia graminis f. sp. tritici]|uniref:Secreted protein n=1 Tax=Puccinia graminis f. sp. tritici TaxID=56615 RepID=A0A5B0RJE3_PUCGR|nr:hypothetical protein PGTUg99_010825 [Puccinia graminis f. sp. tritici]
MRVQYATGFVGLLILLMFQATISVPSTTSSINNLLAKRAPSSDEFDGGCNTCEVSPGVTACCWPPTLRLK